MGARRIGATALIVLGAGFGLSACSGGIHTARLSARPTPAPPATPTSTPAPPATPTSTPAPPATPTSTPAPASTPATPATPTSTPPPARTTPTTAFSIHASNTGPSVSSPAAGGNATYAGLSETDWDSITQGISDAQSSLAQSDQDATYNENGDANP